MPDQITVSEFVTETNEDYKSPTASNFTTRMSHCRNTVAALEEVSKIHISTFKKKKTLRSLISCNGELRGSMNVQVDRVNV